MLSKNAIFISILAVFLICAAGCTQSDVSTSAATPPGGDGAGEETTSGGPDTAPATPFATPEPTVVADPFPDALNIDQRWYYDSETGKNYDEKSSDANLCIQAECYKELQNYQLYDRENSEKLWVEPAPGKEFYLVSVTITVIGGYGTNTYTPYPDDLSVIADGVTYKPMKVISDEWGVEIMAYSSSDYDYDHRYLTHDAELAEHYALKNVGDIYVRSNLYKAGKEKEFYNAWVMYEVPESFNKADAYFKADLGRSEPVWKMHDLLVEVGVQKSSLGGKITASYAGGPNSNVVNDVDVIVTKADGTVIKEKIPPVIGESVEITGTKGEKDHVVVIVNSYSGEGFKKFDEYL